MNARAQDPPAPSQESRAGNGDLLTCAAIAIAALLAFWPALDNAFVRYDDNLYVFENANVAAGLTLDGLGWAFTTGHAGNWHPLTWLSHMLDVEVFGVDARYHHLVNLVLHAASAGLLFLVLRRMTAAWAASLFVAALFALHPLRVESVVWSAERKDLLCGLFWMLTMLAYLGYLRAPSWRRYLLVLAAFVAGLLSKPMIVTLPFVLLLLDVWPLGRWRPFGIGAQDAGAADAPPAVPVGRLLLEKAPLFVLAIASSVVTALVQQVGGAMSSADRLSTLDRIATAVLAYGAYLWKTLWPTNLACLVPHPAYQATQTFEPFGPWVLGSAALLVVVSIAVLRGARRHPYLLVGWLWYLGTLVPVVGFLHVGVHLWADRYTYLPSIGLYVILAWGVGELLRRRPEARSLVGVAAVGILIGCTVLARAQTERWRDDETLFGHALAVTTDNYVAHNGMGMALQFRGAYARAVEHFEKATTIRPDIAEYENNLGHVHLVKGDVFRALEHLERAVEIYEPHAMAHFNLGVAKSRMGREDEAQQHYRDALTHAPDFARPHVNLGAQLMRQGDFEGAIVHLEEAVRLDPRNVNARMNLAQMLRAQGEDRQAIAHYRQILATSPTFADAATGLAWILATSGDSSMRNGREALRLAQQGARATGANRAFTLEALAAAYAETGNFESAVQAQTRALELAPAEERPAVEGRLQFYRARRPYRR